jgi:hypothetical protein
LQSWAILAEGTLAPHCKWIEKLFSGTLHVSSVLGDIIVLHRCGLCVCDISRVYLLDFIHCVALVVLLPKSVEIQVIDTCIAIRSVSYNLSSWLIHPFPIAMP